MIVTGGGYNERDQVTLYTYTEHGCTVYRCTGVQVYCTGVCVQVTLYTEQGWQEDLPRLPLLDAM